MQSATLFRRVAVAVAPRSVVMIGSSSIRSFSTHAHSSHKPSVLVVGGSGALGSAMINTFKHAGWNTVCLDFKSNPVSSSNVTLLPGSSWKANLTLAEENLKELFHLSDPHHRGAQKPLSVVVHCAGTWLGGAVTDSTFVDTVDPMLDINLKSGISAAYLAGKFLTDSGAGLMVLTGAAAAGSGTTLAPTAGMLSYGMSKAATHQLAVSLAQKEGGLRNATVVCVLPTMIDTPSNRAMATSTNDCVNWTPPSEFAELTLAFAQQVSASVGAVGKAATGTTHPEEPVVEHAKVPLKHGGFYHFQTEKGKTTIKLLP